MYVNIKSKTPQSALLNGAHMDSWVGYHMGPIIVLSWAIVIPLIGS